MAIVSQVDWKNIVHAPLLGIQCPNYKSAFLHEYNFPGLWNQNIKLGCANLGLQGLSTTIPKDLCEDCEAYLGTQTALPGVGYCGTTGDIGNGAKKVSKNTFLACYTECRKSKLCVGFSYGKGKYAADQAHGLVCILDSTGSSDAGARRASSQTYAPLLSQTGKTDTVQCYPIDYEWKEGKCNAKDGKCV